MARNASIWRMGRSCSSSALMTFALRGGCAPSAGAMPGDPDVAQERAKAKRTTEQRLIVDMTDLLVGELKEDVDNKRPARVPWASRYTLAVSRRNSNIAPNPNTTVHPMTLATASIVKPPTSGEREMTPTP